MDPLTWRLAYSLHTAHHPDAEGGTCTCGQPYPCPPAQLAARGFRFACGATVAKREDAVAA